MVISVGGAFIRIWRPGSGLVAEVPTCVVSSQDEILALGEEAAAMEGKLSPGQEFLRPFFANHIIHREQLRLLLQQALAQSRSNGSIWERLVVTAAVPPGTPRLHQEWLVRTLREAGLGFVRTVDPLAEFAMKQTKQRKSVPVVGVLDWGFSAARAAIYAGGRILASRSLDHLGLRSLCETVVQMERTENKRIFPLSALYGMQWGLAMTGFDTAAGKSFTGTIQKEVVHQAQQVFADGVQDLLLSLHQQLTAEQVAFLRQSGWLVMGGGSGLAMDVQQWEKTTGVPARVVSGPVYAALQSIG